VVGVAFFQEIVIGVMGGGLARGFWCFVLKDDEGAAVFLVIFGLGDKQQHALHIPQKHP
jgi:hypothetical protein